jgi:hypothetical protein
MRPYQINPQNINGTSWEDEVPNMRNSLGRKTLRYLATSLGGERAAYQGSMREEERILE